MSSKARKIILLTIKRISLALLTLVGLTCLVTFSLLSTQSGRVWLLETAIEQLNQKSDQLRVDLSGLKSNTIGAWRFDNLKVYYQSQLWIEIDKFEGSVKLKPLLDKHIFIQTLHVEQVSYNHLLISTQKGEDADPQSFSMWAIDLQSLSIDTLQLAFPSIDFSPSYSVKGKIEAFKPDSIFTSDLNIESLDSRYAKMSLDFQSRMTTSSIVDITLNLIENTRAEDDTTKRGLIHEFIGSPEELQIDLHFDGNVNLDDNFVLHINKLNQTINKIPIELSGDINANTAFNAIHSNNLQLQTLGNIHDIQLLWDTSGEYPKLETQFTARKFPISIIKPWLPQLTQGTLSSDSSLKLFLMPSNSETLKTLDLKSSLNLDSSFSLKQEFDTQFSLQSEIDTRNGIVQWQQVQLELAREDEVTQLKSTGTLNSNTETIDALIEFDALSFSAISSIAEFGKQNLPDGLRLDIGKTHLSLKGNYLEPAQELSIDLDSQAQGVYRDQIFSAKLKAKSDKAIIDILDAELNIAETVVRASGALDLSTDKNNISIKLDSMPLEQLSLFNLSAPAHLKGTTNATALLRGILKAPELELNADGNFSYPIRRTNGEVREENILMALEANWLKNQLTLPRLEIKLSTDNSQLPLLSANADINFEKTLPAFDLSIESNSLPSSLFVPYGWPDEDGEIQLSFNGSSQGSDTFSLQWLNDLNLTGSGKYRSLLSRSGKKSDAGLKKDIEWRFRFDSNASTADATEEQKAKQRFLSFKSKFEIISEESLASEPAWLNINAEKQSLFESINSKITLPKIELDSQFELASLAFLLDSDQKLEGHIQSKLFLEGAQSSPTIAGNFNLSDGLYRNESLGVFFQDIHVSAVASENAIKVTELELRDEHSGTVKAKGTINWIEPLADKAIDFSLIADSLELVDRDDVFGQLQGTATLIGNFETLTLEGDLELKPLEISIEGNPGSDIPELNYRRVSDEVQEADNSILPTLVLDLVIRATQQAFIRGRGLEAELAGKIKLQGPTSKLSYNGKFKTVRGYFEVFGKRFNLEQGEVGFSNQSVALLVVGRYKKNDSEIRAEISALGEDYSIKLSSIPALPEDEILARLIFGKSVQQMSPLQAVQLASAIQKLRGGGGFDPIGSTRELLGVDTLSIDSNSTEHGNAVTVGAGKYLTDKVYLELERSSDPAHPWQGNILIELTPSVSLESTSGSSSEATVELLWKRDY